MTNPHTSTRAIATDLNLNHITVHKIIKYSLGTHPFKRHTTQRLTPRDMQRRLNFCEWLIEQVNLFKNALSIFFCTHRLSLLLSFHSFLTKLLILCRWILMMPKIIYF